MDKRMVDFVRALRAAGVRISLAESQDAAFGVDAVGVRDADIFRLTLKTTLVKEARDRHIFDEFFPLFFGASTPPPMNNVDEQLTDEQKQQMNQALQDLFKDMHGLRDLMRQLLEGRPFTPEQLAELARMAGMPQAGDLYQRSWFERRMNRLSGLQQMQGMLEQLLDQLAQMGYTQDEINALREQLRENMQGLGQQISQFAGTQIAEQMAEREPSETPDLMDIPFRQLRDEDIDAIRKEIQRLAARLRSRASLRQKRAKEGTPDPRRTMRANMRYGGTPLELKHKKHHIKPQLVVICDVSTSVRLYVEFLLTLIYELQDQVARTNSFIFIDDLRDISMVFKEHEPQQAVHKVLSDNQPGHYNTDLGNSLNTFKQEHMGLINGRTTVIVLGDGRNNYNDPRLDVMSDMHRKARRLLWFVPEHPGQWGSGDSDMLRYLPHSHGAYYVATLRDLADAVDKILSDG
jgi:uncharacterized protein